MKTYNFKHNSAGMPTKASDLLDAQMESRSKSAYTCDTLRLPGHFTPGRGQHDADHFCSAFFHKKALGGYGEPYVGQAVSFVLEEGPKGAAATKVQEEEGGVAVEAPVEDEGQREMGTVKVCLASKELIIKETTPELVGNKFF